MVTYSIISFLLVLVLLAGVMIPMDGASAATGSVVKTKSGLVYSDSLTTGNTANWSLGGTASAYDAYEDSKGLHIGVQSPSSGQWVNYYAGPNHPNAFLYHTAITIPDSTVSDGVFNVGLYVEGSDLIPHVACEAFADSTGYYWAVEQSSDAGATYDILYTSPPSSLPHTQDCTIVTNGDNYLKVYIGGNVVYSSNSLSLGMSAPLVSFVQDDTSSSNSMHYATYYNYYATSGERIKVTNNPSNAATVKVVGSSGQVLASASVVSGTATLDVAKYVFPLAATVNVYDSGNNIIASGPASIYGGDVYSVTAPVQTVPQSPTGLAASAVSQSQINLSWTAPSDDGGSAISGYMIEQSTDGGSTWSDIVPNTGSVSTTYADTGLSAGTTYTYRVSAINSIGASSPSNTASATTSGIIRTIVPVQSGLAASDSLINETASKQQLLTDQKYWHYGGSATVLNSPYDIFKDSQGFHVGVQAPSNGTWAGFYGVTPNTNAELFHAVVSTPVSTISGNFYENGLYVQTYNGSVNYVTCFSDTSSYGTIWAIVSATGNTGGATQFNVLWYDTSPNQPLTRDCTMITNGNNYLKVYLDGVMVYNNSNLDLQMPGPFNAFLEPQTSYQGQMLYGIYKDYYSTTGENVHITSLPSSATRVDLVDGSGNVLASSTVASGSSTIDVGKYHFPLAASIRAYDSSNTLVAVTSGMQNIYGGDTYSSQ